MHISQVEEEEGPEKERKKHAGFEAEGGGEGAVAVAVMSNLLARGPTVRMGLTDRAVVA